MFLFLLVWKRGWKPGRTIFKLNRGEMLSLYYPPFCVNNIKMIYKIPFKNPFLTIICKSIINKNKLSLQEPIFNNFFLKSIINITNLPADVSSLMYVNIRTYQVVVFWKKVNLSFSKSWTNKICQSDMKNYPYIYLAIYIIYYYVYNSYL